MLKNSLVTIHTSMRVNAFKFISIFLVFAFLIGLIPTLTEANLSGDGLLISEVLYDTPGTDSAEEWVELFNPTGVAVDLTGWTLSDNVGSFSLSGSIAAYGYLVVARDNAGFNALYGTTPDLIMGSSLALGNSGDLVTLADNSATEVDFVAWENEVAGWGISAVHTTIIRDDLVDTDTVSDWSNSGDLGTPGSADFAVGNVLITEVLYDTPGPDSIEEWIELYNPSGSSVDLSGWTLSDNVGSVGLSGLIGPQSYLVLARDSAGFNALYGTTPDVIIGGSLALGNSGDQLSLVDDTSTQVDFVAWENSAAGWDVSAVHTTIHRLTIVDTDTVSDWSDSGSIGEPGTGPYSGGGGTDTTPPTVTITYPANGVTLYGVVTITISADDTSGISSYEIYVDGNLQSTTSSYQWDTSITNDGSHTILARAEDGVGNWGEDTHTINVDNTNPPPTDQVKIMVYNIKESGESATHPDWKEVVKEENADIIMFVETGYWDDNSDAKLNQYVTEFNSYFSGENPYVGYTTQAVSYSTSGEAILSRFPIVSTTQIPLVTLDDSSSYDVTHDFYDAVVDVNGMQIHLVGGHLKCCTGTTNEDRREWEQEGINNYFDGLGNVPVMYLGDFNSFSPEDIGLNTLQTGLGYGPMSMLLETNGYEGFAPQFHTFTDVHRALNPLDLGISNPDYDSRIDYIYVNQLLTQYMISSTTGDTFSADTGSDHYSVDVIMNFDGGADVTPPDQVTELSVSAVSGSQIDLSWNANVEPDLDHYNIYRDGLFLTSVTSNSYSDSGLQSETYYSYEVSAVDTSSNEGQNSVMIGDTTFDTTAPAQVMGLSTIVQGTTQIDLTWDTNSEGDLSFYRVYRDSFLIDTTTTASYSDTGLNPSTTYTYQISAIDTSSNEGQLSQSSMATTADPPSGLNHLIISEVYYDATGNDRQREWIEIYNPTTNTVDLSGWSIRDWQGNSFTLSGNIASGEYVVIARTMSGFNNFYGYSADLGSFGFALGNNRDAVYLYDSSQQEVDFVAWENRVPGWDITAQTGQSIARSDLNSDTDSVSDWTLVNNDGTPGY